MLLSGQFIGDYTRLLSWVMPRRPKVVFVFTGLLFVERTVNLRSLFSSHRRWMMTAITSLITRWIARFQQSIQACMRCTSCASTAACNTKLGFKRSHYH